VDFTSVLSVLKQGHYVAVMTCIVLLKDVSLIFTLRILPPILPVLREANQKGPSCTSVLPTQQWLPVVSMRVLLTKSSIVT
jgi:hypothetical protein